ncbi:hypothetical protein [Shewanella algidipiscicola]|uniref:Uncharacterized protein n=1 Tax=Shewanella algidipiscicola TaxID=614070 RepID=A0ABQ4PER9_9GAMM|nr:hypothetical protein [Shewanella algidipiscicola]GIU46050.1 hypothetical protein TUM4630_15590 [Shewanella algidipiscicola]
MTISLTRVFGSISQQGRDNATFAEKLTWVAISLVLLFALLVIDYFINQSDEQFRESDLLPELPVEIQMKQSSGDEIEVIGLYSQFDQPKVVEVKKEVKLTTNIIDSMSLVEQNKQSGLLSKLYIGNAIYRLSGVVQAGEYKAAFSVSYTQAPESRVVSESDANEDRLREKVQQKVGKTNISVFKGDLLGPYTVESIDSRRVVLVDNGRRLWLELFAPLLTKQDSVIK